MGTVFISLSNESCGADESDGDLIALFDGCTKSVTAAGTSSHCNCQRAAYLRGVRFHTPLIVQRPSGDNLSFCSRGGPDAGPADRSYWILLIARRGAGFCSQQTLLFYRRRPSLGQTQTNCSISRDWRRPT